MGMATPKRIGSFGSWGKYGDDYSQMNWEFGFLGIVRMATPKRIGSLGLWGKYGDDYSQMNWE